MPSYEPFRTILTHGTIIIITLFITCLSISSYIIGVNHWKETCDDTSFLPLPIWLVMTVTIILLITTAIIVTYYANRNYSDFAVYYLITIILLILPLTIVGNYIIKTHAKTCEEKSDSLWTVSMITIVFDWIVIGITVIIGIIRCIIYWKTYYDHPQYVRY